MNSLPDEIIELILSFVRFPSSLYPCLLASRRFNNITQRLLSDVTFEGLSQRKRFCDIVSAKGVGGRLPEGVSKLNFGLRPCQRDLGEDTYGSAWEHRLIHNILLDITSACCYIRVLDLSGCQVHDSIFIEAIAHLTLLEGLNISHSSLKSLAVASIGGLCGSTLKYLDISGLLRFRRISSSAISEVVEKCQGLSILVANHCPDFDEEVRLSIQQDSTIRLVWSDSPMA
ncbi:hypothetical protein HDU67_004923 [Dinochytrium kinnereticum]|nr:hypothetical protein HDU67_004923 [Dinochytrium kinnereticum]